MVAHGAQISDRHLSRLGSGLGGWGRFSHMEEVTAAVPVPPRDLSGRMRTAGPRAQSRRRSLASSRCSRWTESTTIGYFAAVLADRSAATGDKDDLYFTADEQGRDLIEIEPPNAAQPPSSRKGRRSHGQLVCFVLLRGQRAIRSPSDESGHGSGDRDRRLRKLPLFGEMVGQAAKWEQAVGTKLSCKRLDERRASRIGAYHPVDLDDDASRNEAKAWAVTTLENLFTSMNHELRSRAKA